MRSNPLKKGITNNTYTRYVLIILAFILFFSMHSTSSAIVHSTSSAIVHSTSSAIVHSTNPPTVLHGKNLDEEQSELSSLWIDLSLGPPLLDLFNQTAKSDDIARVEHISQLDLLRDVTAGQKLVVFKSADDAIRLLPHIHDELDIIGYNLEHGPANPLSEQEDPVGSIKRLREAAEEYGLQVALGPDHNFAISDAVAMAPYADYLILQVQKVQTEPDTVYDFVLPIIEGSREANPDIEISVQIRTEGDVDDLLEMLSPLQKNIDGISILTSEETIEFSENLMGKLRDRSVEATPLPVGVNGPGEDEAITDIITQAANNTRTNADNDLPNDENAPLATVVAAVLEDTSAPEKILSAQTSGETLSTAETNQRAGSTWLFAIIALIAGIALGAGYISYRSRS